MQIELIRAIRSIRERYTKSLSKYMAGEITYEEFLPVKKEWAELSRELSKMQKTHFTKIEEDLAKKYK